MYKLGLDAKLFYGVAGATAATEMTNVKEVTLNLETGEADITTRGSGGWRLTAPTLKEGSVEWQMLWDTTDAAFTAIKNAWLNKDAVALFVSDGDGAGLDADFSIMSFSRSEALEEAMWVSVKAKPTKLTRAPAWKEASPAPEQ